MKTSSSMSGGEEHTRLVSGGAEEAGMKGWREYAADIFTKHGKIAAKMKSAPGPDPTVFSPFPLDAIHT